MRMQPETMGLAVKGRTSIALTNFFPILYHAEVHRLPNPYTRLLTVNVFPVIDRPMRNVLTDWCKQRLRV